MEEPQKSCKNIQLKIYFQACYATCISMRYDSHFLVLYGECCKSFYTHILLHSISNNKNCAFTSMYTFATLSIWYHQKFCNKITLYEYTY